MGFFETLVLGVLVSAAMETIDGGAPLAAEDLAYEVIELAGEYDELWTG